MKFTAVNSLLVAAILIAVPVLTVNLIASSQNFESNNQNLVNSATVAGYRTNTMKLQNITNVSESWLVNPVIQSPFMMAYDPLNQNVYVTEDGYACQTISGGSYVFSEPANCLTVIHGHNIIGTINTTLKNPYNVQYDPFWNSLLVSNRRHTEIISLYNETDLHIFNSSIVVVNTNTGNYYAVGGGSLSGPWIVSVYAGNTFRLIGTINLTKDVSAMAYDSKMGDMVLVTETSLLLVNGTSDKVIQEYPVAEQISNGSSWYYGPRFMAISNTGYGVYLDGQYSGIALVNLTDGNVTWHYDSVLLSASIWSFYYDPALNLIFVGTTSETMTVASGSTGKVIYKITEPLKVLLNGGPGSVFAGMVFDPSDNTLYASWGNGTTFSTGGKIDLIQFEYGANSSSGTLNIYEYAGIAAVIVIVAVTALYFTVGRKKKE